MPGGDGFDDNWTMRQSIGWPAPREENAEEDQK
jgi:hypothetical protein